MIRTDTGALGSVRRTMTARLAALAAVSVAALAAIPDAATAATTCSGTLTGDIRGSVVVPSGASCVLDHANLSGKVKMKRGSTLSSTDSTLGGGVVCGREALRALPEEFSVVCERGGFGDVAFFSQGFELPFGPRTIIP